MPHPLKLDPVVDMAVTWIDPDSDPQHSEFIQSRMIKGIGKDGLKVNTIEQSQNGWIVTLSKNRMAVRFDQTEERALRINWHYLRPL